MAIDDVLLRDYSAAITEAIARLDSALSENHHRLVLAIVYNEKTGRMALAFTPELTPESRHNALLHAQALLSEYMRKEAL